jgi:L-fuconolactonase
MAATAVDAHHHLWHPADPDQGWLLGSGLEPLRQQFGPAELRAVCAGGIAGRRVSETVLVESVPTLRETSALLATAAVEVPIAAVVGWVDLTADVIAQLDLLQSGPGGQLLRGVRHLVESEPDPGWLLREDVQRGLLAVARAGLVYDVLVRPHQLDQVVELAHRLPELPLVLDHAAKPDLRGDADLSPWRASLQRLASVERVVCKVSGLVTEADLNSWNRADLQPAWDTVLELFGPDRLAWGSDWPVCLLAGTWQQWADTAAELAAPLSASEQEAIFGGTARRTYRLSDASTG